MTGPDFKFFFRRHRISQYDIADVLLITQPTVSCYFNGKCGISKKKYAKLLELKAQVEFDAKHKRNGLK